MKTLAMTISVSMLALAACSGANTDTPETETAAATPPTGQKLQIYSARHYDSDQLLYDAFEAATGVEIQVREGNSNQLLETMKAEGDSSPADLILAADAGALWRFQNAGLTQAFTTPALEDKVPASMRQEDGHWYGLTNRIRLVAYDPERIQPDQVDTWAELADPSLEGEICVRASSNIYNLSLMAEIIDRLGEETAQGWAEGIVANMARDPQGGDTDQIRAVAAGECGLAIVNHYYWSRLAGSDAERDKQTVAATRLIIPDFGDGDGAHVNIAGAAIASTAEDPELAAQFIEFLLEEEGQALLTSDTGEVTLNRLGNLDLPTGETMPYTVSSTSLETFGINQADAQRIYDLAGWK
ncbi:MAG: extracellular solute-binding protein [Pseudomonadota bacterium]